MENAHDTLAADCTRVEARFPHRLGQPRTPPIRSTGKIVVLFENDVTGRTRTPVAKPMGGNRPRKRRCAPTSRSRSPDFVFTIPGSGVQLHRNAHERRRRPYGVVIDLIHVAEYVCRRCLCSIATGVIEGACGTWSATVMEFTGARWCYPVPLFHPCAGLDPPGGQLGWSRGGSEAPGATKPAATSMRTGTSTTREYQRGTTPSDTLME